jgi:hypothetical protein
MAHETPHRLIEAPWFTRYAKHPQQHSATILQAHVDLEAEIVFEEGMFNWINDNTEGVWHFRRIITEYHAQAIARRVVSYEISFADIQAAVLFKLRY